MIVTTPVSEPPIHDVLNGIVPMLADTRDVAIESLQGTHLFDTKLDGVRAIAAWDGQRLTMRNRNGRQMDQYLDLEVAAAGMPFPVILDGEIVAGSGKFQDIAARDKRRGAKAVSGMLECPAFFVAFDILWHPVTGDARHHHYGDRRLMLEGLELSKHGGGRWTVSPASTDPKFYDAVRTLGGEGVVAKRLAARYQAGRSQSWLKFKSKHRVTCIGTGYEPGKGARDAFGALFLSIITVDGARQIGKVGSGFTLPETLEMKATLDAATTVADLPLVEIECLGITRDGKLRQPVFIGYRTDLAITDATEAQLSSLPVT